MRKRFLVLLAVTSTCFLVLRSGQPGRPGETARVPDTVPTPPAAAAPRPATAVTMASGAGGRMLAEAQALAYGTRWEEPQGNVLDAFREWSRRYLAASPTSRSAMENEGVELDAFQWTDDAFAGIELERRSAYPVSHSSHPLSADATADC